MPLINGAVSHWFAELPPLRPALPGDRDADVCIVGAGYTGLWTAYYLAKADPSLRIVVLEARFAGFGASGRNGGWLSGLVPGDRNRMAKRHGRDRVLAWQRALNESVDEVIDVAGRESIDAGIVKGGTLHIARNRAQAARLAAEVDEERSWKVDGITALTDREAAERIRIAGVVAAYHNPHCARVQPARLVRGLADAAERLGVTIYEQTPATAIERHRVRTPLGSVTAPVVLRATEGFTVTLPGLRRRWLPMNSSMIATDPLPERIWDAIGWRDRETLGETAHGFFYAQRTVDNRIAIGGRSVPYRYGSGIDRDGRVPQRTIAHLTEVLRSVLPQVRDVPIAHGWCGVLAAAGLGGDRDVRPGNRFGVGRRIRRARRHRRQPGRAHPGRSGARAAHPAHGAAVGRAPVAQLGTRAVALARRARHVPGLPGGRPARVARPRRHVADRGRRRQDRRPSSLDPTVELLNAARASPLDRRPTSRPLRPCPSTAAGSGGYVRCWRRSGP